MTIKEAATLRGVTLTYIRRLVAEGVLRAEQRLDAATGRPYVWIDGRSLRHIGTPPKRYRRR